MLGGMQNATSLPTHGRGHGAAGTPSVLNGLGQALRWLRERPGRKQYQVADTAGITKGMLSSYETGRQRPSLETLEKVLDALHCDLHDLHNALQIVNGRPQIMRQRLADAVEAPERAGGGTDVYKILGLAEQMPLEEEKAIAQILDGFHRLIRYLHREARKGLDLES
jgi:transcriptional regulator with XRE-family HTH domain